VLLKLCFEHPYNKGAETDWVEQILLTYRGAYLYKDCALHSSGSSEYNRLGV
jgi:hypothetical protein